MNLKWYLRGKYLKEMLELKQYFKNIGLTKFLFQVYFKGSDVKKKIWNK